MLRKSLISRTSGLLTIPWPVVHPLLKRVPKPTKSPPSKYPQCETTGILGSTPRRSSSVKYFAKQVFEKRRKVDQKTSFQASIGVFMCFFGSKTIDEAIPLEPKISPENRRSIPAERPGDGTGREGKHGT